MADINTHSHVVPAAGSTKSKIILRGPSTSPSEPATAFSFTPPTMEFLQGQWRVTHSTLPMWKSSRNITITYTPLSDPPGAIDDLVRYQPLDSDKEKTVHGVDTPDKDIQAKYTWRGRHWLKIASSEWEILGYGDQEGGWAVTYFAKTLFTPAGIDIYARGQDGISASLLDSIKSEMKVVHDKDFHALAEEIFEIRHD